MTYYEGITDGELRLVRHHLEAALDALERAKHFAGSSATLAHEIQSDITSVIMQMASIDDARRHLPKP